ncbi:MAG TPA: AAA family ATPase [Candidatus Babeliales bacterium]|nr:AAA family ATPase [Candidatus Babeliales bacterium]
MIYIIVGQQGSGKTLLAVKELLSYHRKKYKIISNVNLLGVKHDIIDYDKVVNCEYDKAVVFIDEIHQLLPARGSMSKKSIAIVDGFLSMIRKKKVILIGTTQYERKMDVRLRMEKDYLIMCERYICINNSFQKASPDFFDSNVPAIISCKAHCIFDQSRQDFFFIANHYYKYYDTRQIILIRKSKKEDKHE